MNPEDEPKTVDCKKCKGYGFYYREVGNPDQIITEDQKHKHDEGALIFEDCPECGGSGIVYENDNFNTYKYL